MDKQTSRLLWLVASVWALNIVMGMIPPLDYEPDPAINGVFTAFAGMIFVADRVGNRGGAHRRSQQDETKEEEVK